MNSFFFQEEARMREGIIIHFAFPSAATELQHVLK
jgi:hypothetical protein